jgi:hypothetical protein
VGVAHDGRVVFDLALKLAEAAHELVVELALLNQRFVPSGERLLGQGEFFGERGDGGLRVARQLSLEIRDLILETSDEAEDGVEALVVESTDGAMAENGCPPQRNKIGSRRRRK